jgi:asparagine synthase (glutamine-hydrolysing)
MCGITGFLTSSLENEFDLRLLVRRMARQLSQRGPDDSGVWVDRRAGVALGHQRLSILDLSPEGHQPMHSRSGRYVITFNGEVYNFRDLRRELETMGHAFRGHSDTEVILAAMEQWGFDDSLPRLNGMFAFAVWDREEHELRLVRDRLGEKPLYYGWSGKSFLFGSELKALVAHPGFRGEVNRTSLTMYLRYGWIPAPYSVYRGLFKLPPATSIRVKVSDEGIEPVPVAYWSIEDAVRRGLEDPFRSSAEEAEDCLDELLRDAIKMRMVADVPLGAFLSGGIDSSTIVALMQAQSTNPVKTFSIGFSEDAYNEARYASAVAEHLGTDHTEFYVSPEDARHVIPQLPGIYDEPFSDSSQIPTYLVSQLARRHVTVSLSGDGGDELFGGYKRYFVWGDIWRKVSWLPEAIRQSMSQALRCLSPEQWNHVAGLLRPIYPRAGKVSYPGDKVHRLAGMLAGDDPVARYRAIVSAFEPAGLVFEGCEEPAVLLSERCLKLSSADFCRQMMLLDAMTYLPDDILVKVDRASMAVSLEARVPFLDHRVVEFAARLPMSMKVQNGEGKWALRRVLERYVPKKLFERPKKGFSLPVGEWLRGPLREWAEALLQEDRLKREGYFDSAAARKLWAEHLSGQRDVENATWALLMFQAWLERWRRPAIEAERVPPLDVDDSKPPIGRARAESDGASDFEPFHPSRAVISTH